jgi:hypothetical protein
MSLANIKRAANAKGFICKVYPKKFINMSTVHSTNILKIDFSYYVKSIYKGVGYTTEKVGSISELVSENQFYHDRDAGVLYYYTLNPSEQLVVTFGFFFKTGETEPLHIDLNDVNSDLVLFDGRMLETSFAQNIEDISNGKLGINSTSITLINVDGYYQPLADDNVTFKNSEIIVNLYYNTPSNNIVAFVGMVESASFKTKEMVLDARDSNKKLLSIAKYTELESEFKAEIVLKNEYYGKEIPFLLGRRCNLAIDWTPKASILYSKQDQEYVGASQYSSVYDTSKDGNIELISISEQNITVTYYTRPGVAVSSYNVRSRKFYGCRSINNLFSHTYLTINRNSVIDKQPNYSDGSNYGLEIEFPVPDASKYYVGQLVDFSPLYPGDFPINNYSVNDMLCVVSYVDIQNNKISITKSSRVTSLVTKSPYNDVYYAFFSQFSIFEIDNNKPVYFLPLGCVKHTSTNYDGTFTHKFEIARYGIGNGALGYHYLDSNNSEVLTGGALAHKINETDQSTESQYQNNSTSELKSSNLFVNFITPTTNLSLGSIIHRTIKCAGLETDGGDGLLLTNPTSSFKDLDSKIQTYFALHSGMFDTYLDGLEMMLSSIFGFLYINSEGKIGVRLFEKNPYNHKTFYLSEDDMVNGSISSDFDVSNIYTRLTSISPLSNNSNFRLDYADQNKVMLHGDIAKEERFYIEDMGIYNTKVFNRKYEFYSNAIRKFSFSVISNGYEIELGDKINTNFTISQKWLGHPKQYELFVIGVNKSLQGCEITAIENIFPEL